MNSHFEFRLESLRKRNTAKFKRVMELLNRKQIPVCVSCHNAIHAGRYDGLKLGDLAVKNNSYSK